MSDAVVTGRCLCGRISCRVTGRTLRSGFCPARGSSPTDTSSRFPNYIQPHLGSLDDPDAVRPLAQVHRAEKVAWFEVADGLPRYSASAADDGDWKQG